VAHAGSVATRLRAHGGEAIADLGVLRHQGQVLGAGRIRTGG
jgi:hypothetical protein